MNPDTFKNKPTNLLAVAGAHSIRATYFNRIGGKGEDSPATPTTFAEIAARIRSDHFKEKTETVRAASDKEAAKALKKNLLPVFVPAVATVRGDEGLVGQPEYLQIDIDDYDPHAAALTLDAFKSDKHVALAFKSPRGGAKAFVRIDPTRPHAESWAAGAKYVKDVYGVTMDTDTRGASRACYYTWDPDCYLAPGPVEVIPYPTVALPAQAPVVASAPAATTTRPPCSKADVIELLRYIEPMEEHDHDHRTNVVGAVASELSEADTVEVCSAWGKVEPSKIENDLTHPKTEFTLGSLVLWAREGGWKPSSAFRATVPDAEIKKAEQFALQQELDARRFGNGTPPPKPVPRFLLKGIPICTSGNITTIQSQAKTGKTAVVAAMTAAAIVAENGGHGGGDTLGFTAAEPGGLTILHFDCEQSTFHHHQSLTQSLKRAGVEACPSYLKSYGLAGYSAEKLLAALRMRTAQEAEGPGLFAIVLDGFGDFLNDVNEAREANPLVAELHDMAIRYDCAVIGVLHENPGKMNQGEKSRGHLGSQLQRKSETNLVLKRESGSDITVIYADKTRGAPITEKSGHRFKWSDADGMHMTDCSLDIGIGSDVATEFERHGLRSLAEQCFTVAGVQSLANKALSDRIMAIDECSVATAGRKIKRMKELRVISLHGRSYTLWEP